MLLNASYRIG